MATKPIDPRLFDLAPTITNKSDRAMFCCVVGMTGADRRCRPLLESCLGASSFWDDVIQARLDWWKSKSHARLPVTSRRKKPKKFTGLPSLLEGMPSDFDLLQPSSPDDLKAIAEKLRKMPPFEVTNETLNLFRDFEIDICDDTVRKGLLSVIDNEAEGEA